MSSNSWSTPATGTRWRCAPPTLINMEFIQFHPTGMVWPAVGEGHPRHRRRSATTAGSEELRRQTLHVRLHPPSLPGGQYAETEEEATSGSRTTTPPAAPPTCCPATVARAIQTQRSRRRGTAQRSTSTSTRMTPEEIKKRLPSMYHPVHGVGRSRHHQGRDEDRPLPLSWAASRSIRTPALRPPRVVRRG